MIRILGRQLLEKQVVVKDLRRVGLEVFEVLRQKDTSQYMHAQGLQVIKVQHWKQLKLWDLIKINNRLAASLSLLAM